MRPVSSCKLSPWAEWVRGWGEVGVSFWGNLSLGWENIVPNGVDSGSVCFQMPYLTQRNGTDVVFQTNNTYFRILALKQNFLHHPDRFPAPRDTQLEWLFPFDASHWELMVPSPDQRFTTMLLMVCGCTSISSQIIYWFLRKLENLSNIWLMRIMLGSWLPLCIYWWILLIADPF